MTLVRFCDIPFDGLLHQGIDDTNIFPLLCTWGAALCEGCCTLWIQPRHKYRQVAVGDDVGAVRYLSPVNSASKAIKSAVRIASHIVSNDCSKFSLVMFMSNGVHS